MVCMILFEQIYWQQKPLSANEERIYILLRVEKKNQEEEKGGKANQEWRK